MSAIGLVAREERSALLARLEAEGRIVPECPGCRALYEAADPCSVFAPRHKPSPRCESGSRPHCTCDTCF